MPPLSPRAHGGPSVVASAREASAAAEALLADATQKVRARVMLAGRAIDRRFDSEQRATHGLAWIATYAEALRQLAAYADRLSAGGRLG